MCLLEEHAGDLISGLVYEMQLGAVGALAADEVAQVVDPAQDAESCHSLVEVADVQGVVSGGGGGRGRGRACDLEVDLVFISIDDHGLSVGHEGGCVALDGSIPNDTLLLVV